MAKVLFIPVSIVSGLIAGLIGKKIFEGIWGLIDDEEPPDAEDRETSVPKLVGSLAFQGAIFAVARGLTDHDARQSFYRATGVWPGEERPRKRLGRTAAPVHRAARWRRRSPRAAARRSAAGRPRSACGRRPPSST